VVVSDYPRRKKTTALGCGFLDSGDRAVLLTESGMIDNKEKTI